jgi:uncharacterized protein YdhG (YjbR/CyaY superfamily)
MKSAPPPNMDAYIESFPPEVQVLLQQIRATVHDAAPAATEDIKYGMPAFIWNGHLVLFAAFKNHIGFYPAPTGVKSFEKDLAGYKTGKGSVQFPLDRPMPLKLITKIVQYRLKKNAASRQSAVGNRQ